MSCRVALLRLNRKEILNLPQAYERPCFNTEKGYDDDKSRLHIPEIECRLSELGEIKIVRIRSRYQRCTVRYLRKQNLFSVFPDYLDFYQSCRRGNQSYTLRS